MSERECPTCSAVFLDDPPRRRCPACGDVLPQEAPEEELPVVRGTVAPPPGLSEFLYLVGPPKPTMRPPGPPPHVVVDVDADE